MSSYVLFSWMATWKTGLVNSGQVLSMSMRWTSTIADPFRGGCPSYINTYEFDKGIHMMITNLFGKWANS